VEQVQEEVDELARIADALKELDLFVAETEAEFCRCNERYCQESVQKMVHLDKQVPQIMIDITRFAELMTVTLKDWDQHWPDEFLGIVQLCHRLGQEKILNRELTPLLIALMTLDPNWAQYVTGPKVNVEGSNNSAKYFILGKLANRFPQDWLAECVLSDQWAARLTSNMPHPNGKAAAERAARLRQHLKEQKFYSLRDLRNTKKAVSCVQQFCEMMRIASFLKRWRPTAEGVLLLTSCLRSGSLLSSSTLQLRLRATIKEHFDLCSPDEQRQILEALAWDMSPQLEEWSSLKRQALGPPANSGFPMDDRYREMIQAFPCSQPGVELVRELRERFP
jgi:hypothetical protein